MSRRQLDPIAQQVAEQVHAMRSASHKRMVEDLRMGVKQRSIQIPSGRVYRRRDKHAGRNDA